MSEKKSEVTEEIVSYMRKEMPDAYKNFFRAVKEYEGKLNTVLYTEELEYLHKGEVPPENIKEEISSCHPTKQRLFRIPHPVHWREGMAVRNSLRECEHCKDWTDHDFDDNWIEVVERAIERKESNDGK